MSMSNILSYYIWHIEMTLTLASFLYHRVHRWWANMTRVGKNGNKKQKKKTFINDKENTHVMSSAWSLTSQSSARGWSIGDGSISETHTVLGGGGRRRSSDDDDWSKLLNEQKMRNFQQSQLKRIYVRGEKWRWEVVFAVPINIFSLNYKSHRDSSWKVKEKKEEAQFVGNNAKRMKEKQQKLSKNKEEITDPFYSLSLACTLIWVIFSSYLFYFTAICPSDKNKRWSECEKRK